MEDKSGIGYLIVNVATARGAIPLPGASVTVYYEEPDNTGIHSVLTTDMSGKTEKIPLPAPNRALSETPGNIKPYATYTVTAEKDGYYTATGTAIPIFEGITSIQPLEMLPQAEYEPDKIFPRFGLDIVEDRDQKL